MDSVFVKSASLAAGGALDGSLCSEGAAWCAQPRDSNARVLWVDTVRQGCRNNILVLHP